MSISNMMLVDCPHCGTANLFKRYASVNADRSPSLRAAILDRSFFATECLDCGKSFRAPPDFTYMDQELGLWVNARPFVEQEAGWLEGEQSTQIAHLQLFVMDAPPVVQRIGEGLRARLTFGWPALREKILCRQHGIDDVALELAKLAATAGAQGAMFVDGGELRVVEVDGEALRCAWFSSEDLEPQGMVTLPRALLAEIEADPEPWAVLEERLSSGFYVDMARALSDAA
ncbi:MAG: CpXC domain-containing protein [Alphaproteobacteria bacterium]|nr:CpXC domain-containing protein [Alphaproteobacteria bacterium]